MPKFLDAPSWYDSDGNKRTIVTTMRIGVSNTGSGCYCNVPVISEGSTNLGDIPEQPLYTLPFISGAQSVGAIPYWSGTQNGYRVMGQGSSGQVLTSNGNAAPSWGKSYTHLIVIGTSDSTSQMSGAAVFTVNNFSSEEYTREEIISFLETVKTQFKSGGASALDGLPCFFTSDTKNNSGDYLAPAGCVWAEDGVVYISGVIVMTNRLDNEPTFGQRTGSFTASQSYFQIFRDWVISAP